MQVELVARFVVCPCAVPGCAKPVVWRAAVSLAVGPHVIGPVLRLAARKGVDEPGVRIRRVVRHEVQQDRNVTFTGLRDKAVNVLESAELRVDAVVIRNVITPVVVR